MILSYCTSVDQLKLLNSCRYLRHFPRPTYYTIQDLTEIETWPAYDTAGQHTLVDKRSFACCVCIRLRPVYRFSNDHMTGNYSKCSSYKFPGTYTRRVCIDCAVSLGIFKRGKVFEYGGKTVGPYYQNLGAGVGVVCNRCGEFGRLRNRNQVTLRWCTPCEKGMRDKDPRNPPAFLRGIRLSKSCFMLSTEYAR